MTTTKIRKPKTGKTRTIPNPTGARSLWSGSISFGLVNIPVRMVTAVRDEAIRFHLLHDQDNVRLQRKMVSPTDGKEVPPDHIVKGYQLSPDKFIVVSQDELDAVAPEKSHTIEITDFVEMSEIDPLYYDKPYYLLPDRNAAKAYHLLLEAMQKSGKVGIARFVMRDHETLAALRPVDGVLCLETMHFGDEIMDLKNIDGLQPGVHPGEKELETAGHLIESLAGEFHPEDYRDEYKERLEDLVHRKAKTLHIKEEPPKPGEKSTNSKAVDLMAALQASVDKARRNIKHDVAEHKGQSGRKRKSA